MRVRRVSEPTADGIAVEVLDDAGQPIEAIAGFMRYLAARCRAALDAVLVEWDQRKGERW